jgi:hypothetical protein
MPRIVSTLLAAGLFLGALTAFANSHLTAGQPASSGHDQSAIAPRFAEIDATNDDQVTTAEITTSNPLVGRVDSDEKNKNGWLGETEMASTHASNHDVN